MDRPDPGTATTTPKVRFPLWIKLSVFSALLATLPTLTVVLVTLDRHQQTLRTLTWERMVTFGELITETQESIFTDAYSGLEATAAALSDPNLDADARLALASALIGGHDLLDHADIYDAQGAWLDTLREEGAPSRKAELTLPLALRERASDPAQQVAYDKPLVWGQELRVPMVVPIRAQGRVTGFVASHVLLEKLRQRVHDLGQERATLRAYVVDQDLRLLAWSDTEPRQPLQRADQLSLVQTFSEGMSRGLGGAQPFTDPQGRERLGALRPLPERGWAVVVDTPLDVAYSTLHEVRRWILFLLAGALVVSVLAALWLSRSVTAPIDQLMVFVGALSQRRFDARAGVRTRDELAVLGGAMERAAQELEAGERRMIEEAAIRQDLGRYLSREVVERVVRREQDMNLGGQRRQITVLFADVVRFTPLAEGRAPEEVVAILNQLFTILTEIIFRHGGTVDKFIGDSVMAFWGAPDAQEDHATRAVEAAEDMMRWLELGNANWRMEHQIDIELAIGICSGEAIVGNVGSKSRMAYTAIGHIVNTAARLEAIAQPNQILIAGQTAAALPEGAFALVSCGQQQFPNTAQPVELFEVRL
jgi:adenylate cyclase